MKPSQLWAASMIALTACSGKIIEPAPYHADAGSSPADAGSAPSATPTMTVEGASQTCTTSNTGAPLLRRLTQGQIENTLRDVFPQVGSAWSGYGLSDVSSSLGFSNDADTLVVSAQTAQEYLASAEQLAGLLSDPSQLSSWLPCAKSAPDAACGGELISRYGKRLFRRPLTDDEQQRYRSLFDSVAASGSPQNAVKWTLVALLQSPSTLYRREIGDLAGDVSKLSDYELATELAYDFSDTAPDEALLARAERGELSDPDVRLIEARRLLETPRGHAMVQQFFREWLRYDAVRTADRSSVPGFEAIRPELITETERFIDYTVYDAEGGVSELLTAPYTFIDPQLAEYYDFDAPAGGGSTRQTRPAERGVGLLSQGSLLARAANVAATSPTQRGLVIYEKLLCHNRPRPPANVPPLSSSDPTTYKTTRQHYELAHAQNFCASCHSQFDPLGFAFEHFDQGGRYRETESGEPIDASGTIHRVNGASVDFDGAEALASQLAQLPEVVDCVSGLLVQYAFGGGGGASCLAEEARAALRQGDYGLIEALAQLSAARHFSERDQASAANGGSPTGGPDPGAAEPADAGTAGDASDPSASDGGRADAAAPAAASGDAAAEDIGLSAQYQANNSAPHDNVIGPFLQISNAAGRQPVPLSSLQLRYYFSNEHSVSCPDGCKVEGYYAGIHPTGMGVPAQRSYVPVQGDRAYLQISFAADAPALEPGQSVEVQQYFHTNPYLEFDESDDYSFDPSKTAYADAPRVTIYKDGVLVWGTPPP